MTPPPATANDFIPNFDTAAAREELVNTGTPDKAASGIVKVVVDSQSNLATKADLQTGLSQLEAKMHSDNLKTRLWLALGIITLFAKDYLPSAGG